MVAVLHRHFAISQLSQLCQLDDTAVTFEERQEAERIYSKYSPNRHTPKVRTHPYINGTCGAVTSFRGKSLVIQRYIKQFADTRT